MRQPSEVSRSSLSSDPCYYNADGEKALRTVDPAGAVQETGRGDLARSKIGGGPGGRSATEAAGSGPPKGRLRGQPPKAFRGANRYKLVRAFDLLKTYGVNFYQQAGQLSGTLMASFPEHDAPVSATDNAWLLMHVHDYLLPLVDEFGLDSTRNEIDRLAGIMDAGTTYRTAREFIKSVARRYVDDLREVYFLYVQNPGNYLRPLEGWEEVIARFQDLTEDIEEAEKCVALNRFTACVFHLMRVVERGAQEFGNALGVKHTFDKEWGIITNEVVHLIQKLPDSTQTEKAYKAQAHDLKTHLDHVRWAWRNPTMHPKQTYVEEEAYDILAKSRTFMSHLVAFI